MNGSDNHSDVPSRVSVLCDEPCHLGEGPAYDADTDTAWWFDIVERRLFEANLSNGTIAVHDLPFMASALAYVDDGRQLLATESGLALREISTGRLDMILPIEADTARTRSNDARAHRSGSFWFSTMGRQAEPDAGSIYVFRDGAAQPILRGLTIPNAICFSPDGTIGYFADSSHNQLCRVRLDPATGVPIEAPSVLHHHLGRGEFDGAVTDAEGLIWCAIWGGAQLNVYSPDGQLVRNISVPARQPSCPVFVGRNFDHVLVTSAFQNMDAAARAADPCHGQTFLLKVNDRGRPEPRVVLESHSSRCSA